MLTPLAATIADPPVDLAALLGVLLAAWGAGFAASRMGYPAVLGELVAGILLGPTLLGVLSAGKGLDAIGELGIVLMMLYIGTEIDIDDLRKASRAGLYAALGGFLVPFAAGFALILAVKGDVIAAIFVGTAMGVTSLATKSRILADLRLFDTRIAYVLVAGALLSDTATLIIFAAVLSLAGGSIDLGTVVVVGAEAIGFFAIMFVAGRWVFPWLGQQMVRGRSVDLGAALTLFVGAGLAAAALAEVLGLHPILGSFVAGLFLTNSVPERTSREVSHLVERLSIRILAPVFFVTAGFAISLEAIVEEWQLLVAVVAVATIGKVVGTALAYLPTGHGWREGTVIGAAMNGRGAVEIVVAGIGLEAGLIDEEIFTVLVLMAIITTAFVPVMLRAGVEWLRGRGELDPTTRRQHVTIVGAGPVGVAMAEALRPGAPVAMVDANLDRVRRARRRGLAVEHGDALDLDVLEDAHAGEARLVIAVTSNVEVNLLVAQLCWEQWRVNELLLAVNGDALARTLDLLEGVPAKALLPDGVDLPAWENRLTSGRAHVTTLAVGEGDGEGLKARLDGGDGVLPLVVARGERRLAFVEAERLEAGDEVVVVELRRDPGPALASSGTDEDTSVPVGYP